MKYMIAVLLILLPLLVSCVSAKSRTQSLVFEASRNIYTHEHSGFVFPPSINNFHRDNDIKFYDETGNNFSVPYNLVTSQEKAIATIYIYPSLLDYSITPIPKLGQTPEWFFKEQYDEAKTSIINVYRARVISEGVYRVSSSLLNPSGRKGVFEWDTIGGEKVFSHLYLFTHKGWFVKYRFTYPSKYDAIIGPEIEKFIASFEWP